MICQLAYWDFIRESPKRMKEITQKKVGSSGYTVTLSIFSSFSLSSFEVLDLYSTSFDSSWHGCCLDIQRVKIYFKQRVLWNIPWKLKNFDILDNINLCKSIQDRDVSDDDGLFQAFYVTRNGQTSTERPRLSRGNDFCEVWSIEPDANERMLIFRGFHFRLLIASALFCMQTKVKEVIN